MATLEARSEIPIIDLTHLGTAETPCKSGLKNVATQLHKSLSCQGLALLVNHGISCDKLRSVNDAMDSFCALPGDVQDLYKRTREHNHGYVAPGVEMFRSTEHVKEVRHTFNVSWLDRLMPESEVPGFTEAVASLARDFLRLTTWLLQALALGLDLPCEYFLASHSIFEEGNETCMRLLCYPAFPAPPQPGETRCGEHADYGTFTLQAQDCEGGLEIMTEDKKWKAVGHLPGAILVNTGELLTALTNGKYPALLHRVVVPEEPIVRNRSRHCIAFFVFPNSNLLIKPIENARTAQDSETNWKPHEEHKTFYTADEHLQMRYRQAYAE